MAQPVPALVVVGFLGSGKTTLMSHLLQQAIARGIRVGLVVNDFDEFSVDSHMLQQQAGGQNVLELPGGCMCCQLGDDLAGALNTLMSLREFDWFFIETSGLAEPLEVIHQLTTPALLPSIAPRLMVAVIDIEGPVPEQDGARLVWEQARASQVVLLNKADQIRPEVLERAAERIRQYNPTVEVVITRNAQVDLDLLFAKAGEVRAPAYMQRSHAHLHAAFNSWARRLPDDLQYARFEAFLQQLPAAVVRAKGFVRFSDAPGTYFFNRVGEYVQMAPLPEGSPPGMLVCIGKNLEPAALEELFQQTTGA